jgi:hypothetical protein
LLLAKPFLLGKTIWSFAPRALDEVYKLFLPKPQASGKKRFGLVEGVKRVIARCLNIPLLT